MEIRVEPARLELAADALERRARTLLDAAAGFAADARRLVPETGRGAAVAAGGTADAAHHATLVLAVDLERIAAALRTAAGTYTAADAHLFQERP